MDISMVHPYSVHLGVCKEIWYSRCFKTVGAVADSGWTDDVPKQYDRLVTVSVGNSNSDMQIH